MPLNEKEKQLIESFVHSIQAQCELLLFHVNQADVEEEKSKKTVKEPFTGKNGVCDKQCDDKDIINLTTFGKKKGFQCRRCGMKVEKNG